MRGKIFQSFTGILLAVFLVVVVAGCNKDNKTNNTSSTNSGTNTTTTPNKTDHTSTQDTTKKTGDNKSITEAEANLEPLGNTKVEGKVEFVKTAAGMEIEIELSGLTPGKHGIHLHEFGDCSSPDGKSAGEHFNPGKKEHGDMTSGVRHDGDLGNITADADGKVKVKLTDKVMTFDGPNSILGKSVIVHEKEDDLKTQPSGNSGNRLACGVIKED